MLKYSSPNPWGRVYILLGLCGGVLGGWGAGDRPHQAVLHPLLVCCDLHKLST
ncbi:hypothetical protein Taro_007315 [Colocasia esculenta]|uniref:Uncharacterized protein n=1 Tax=Colocasia esculenta TaxID=4460 RepID=A0A843TYL3_COLES|nr:hypothetical protein [Colocasia esculenta]